MPISFITAATQLDWLAVLIAFVVAAAVAAVYFPVLIAKPYAAALGRQDAPKTASNPVTNIGPIVCILLTVITSALLLRALQVSTVPDAIVFGLVVGVGYLTVMTFQIAINPNFPRPLLYGAINAPYFIVTSVVSSVILVVVR